MYKPVETLKVTYHCIEDAMSLIKHLDKCTEDKLIYSIKRESSSKLTVFVQRVLDSRTTPFD